MKKSKFTEAQIAFILKQAEEGTPIAEVCRKAGDVAPLMPSFITRIRSGCGPAWTGLRTRSG